MGREYVVTDSRMDGQRHVRPKSVRNNRNILVRMGNADSAPGNAVRRHGRQKLGPGGRQRVRRMLANLALERLDRRQGDTILDNESAKIETRIRRALATGARSKRELQQRTAAARSGKWLWNNALQNLVNDEEIRYDSRSKLYRLVTE